MVHIQEIQIQPGRYVRALLEAATTDLSEGAEVVKVSCGKNGCVAHFDAETLCIRGLWDQGRSLRL